jgi:hypothetical protein
VLATPKRRLIYTPDDLKERIRQRGDSSLSLVTVIVTYSMETRVVPWWDGTGGVHVISGFRDGKSRAHDNMQSAHMAVQTDIISYYSDSKSTSLKPKY